MPSASKPKRLKLSETGGDKRIKFIGTLNRITYENLLYSGIRYCALSKRRISCYYDSELQSLQDSYKLIKVTSLQLLLPVDSSNSLYCFELGVSNSESSAMRHSSSTKITFGCANSDEMLTWARKIAANLTPAFRSISYSEFTLLGRCCLKVGESGEWLAAWLLLAGMELSYYCAEDTADTVDLRRTKCISILKPDEESKKACISDCCFNLRLDCSFSTLYLRFPNTAEFQNWNSAIRAAAHSDGLQLDVQQLTNEGVPVIVDKCIDFVNAYGVQSEGIYRRAGRRAVIMDLLKRFRANALVVQLTPQIYSQHDVAGVLKRFFRDLPTPLISRECHDRLITVLVIRDACSRLEQYKNALVGMGPVSFNTARKLFTHLNFIQKWNEGNNITAENMAEVWAPIIMRPWRDTSGQQITSSDHDETVVREMILNGDYFLSQDEDKIKQDQVCHVIIGTHESARPLPQPCSAGDLRFRVTLQDNRNHFLVFLTPNKTSADVCVELSAKMDKAYHEIMLVEEICNGRMHRIVHKSEIVLDVVTRWTRWDVEDRKHNYLVIKENKILHEMDSLEKNMKLLDGKLRYANDANKIFNLYDFKIISSKLSGCLQGSSTVEEWNIKDFIWYFGHETQRGLEDLKDLEWAITFIPKNKTRRCKEHPYFGSTLINSLTGSQLQWASALMFAQHDSILSSLEDFLP